jgi:hypothetical protein
VPPGDLWEQLANVEASIEQTKAQLVDRYGDEIDGKSRSKRSAAYVALEKLCGLKEEDIAKHNMRYKKQAKGKGDKMKNYFMHASFL